MSRTEVLSPFMIRTKENNGLADALRVLPRGSVVSVIGAGGKTTTVHQLAHFYRHRGFNVLVTTTTQMALEEPVCTTSDEISRALEREGYAFAASRLLKRGVWKAASLPDDVLAGAIREVDLTVIEADGARCLPFKIPKPTEPVIAPQTTHIVLAAGMKAVGRKVGETVYNAEAFFDYPEAAEDILTPEMMAEAYKKTFLRRLDAGYPGVPVIILAGQADTPERESYAKRFLEAFDL